MIKNCLFALALASLALAGGCAKGGNGIVPPPPSVTVTITSPAGTNPGAIYPGQSVTLTAAVANSTSTAVTWSLSPTGAGTLTPVTPPTTPATATYQAPATVPAAGSQPTITATLVSDTSIAGPLALTVVDITTDVAPATLSIGTGLTQQFTAVAVPDAAPQDFTWSCNVGGSGGPSCAPANFCYGSNCNPAIASGLAIYTYTAADSCNGKGCIQISANSTLDPNICANSTNCTIGKVSPVASRVSGTYAFQFSGYDNSNNPIAVAGTFTALSGMISGAEEVLTANGPSTKTPIQITGGTYTPTSADPHNSNNAGTLTLYPSGVTQCGSPAEAYPCQYQVVLDGAGDIQMIESDNNGTGSGIAQISSYKSFTGATDQTYAFGFTGVDFGGNRVGYVGLLPMNGSGMVVGGQMDVNDNGNGSNICGAGPCSISSGSYTADQNISGLWHMTLTPAAAAPMNFDFFISSGTANKTNPLTFYAISTDPITTHPAVSGTMVLQDSSLTYDKAHFKGTSITALTGANGPNTNVSLTLGTTDGNGNFSGQFDQNNAGTILSSVQFPGASQSPSPYTYAASGSANGRYTFNILGNPTASPVVAPLPFVLYATGANRGFLLDQSSSSVMTGTMNPQGQAYLGLPSSALPGTYAAATTSSGSSAVDAIAANLLLTWANVALVQGGCTSECVNGTQYDSLNYSSTGTPLALAYTLQDTGNGTIVPISPATTPNYVIYVQDISGCTKASGPVCTIQDFLMMDVDKTNPNASIIFAQQ